VDNLWINLRFPVKRRPQIVPLRGSRTRVATGSITPVQRGPGPVARWPRFHHRSRSPHREHPDYSTAGAHRQPDLSRRPPTSRDAVTRAHSVQPAHCRAATSSAVRVSGHCPVSQSREFGAPGPAPRRDHGCGSLPPATAPTTPPHISQNRNRRPDPGPGDAETACLPQCHSPTPSRTDLRRLHRAERSQWSTRSGFAAGNPPAQQIC
jgi:hypothetical protein